MITCFPDGLRRRISGMSPGFTLVELLIVVAALGILIATALPTYTRAKDKARETETIANLGAIEVALERYHTDWGKYPLFLMGGDAAGWADWQQPERRSRRGLPQGDVRYADPYDVLIEGAYLSSYPTNPFMGAGTAVLRQTSGLESPVPGDGDPRFGLNGTSMGNGIDDSCFFENTFDDPMHPIETFRTQPGSDPARVHPYAMGGRRILTAEGTFGMVASWWPGNFCYAAGGIVRTRKEWFFFPGLNYPTGATYLLAVYGSLGTPGADLIRLEATDPAGGSLPSRDHYFDSDYNYGPDDSFRYSFRRRATDGRFEGGLPAMFGGGNAWQAPYFPGDTDPDLGMDWIFGAPDGQPDGIIAIRPLDATYAAGLPPGVRGAP